MFGGKDREQWVPIYSSQTQPGDQLVMLVAQEMGQQLQRLSNPRSEAGAPATTIAGAVLLREKPLWSGGPGLLELENRNGHGNKVTQEAYEMELTQGGAKAFKQPLQLVARLLNPFAPPCVNSIS